MEKILVSSECGTPFHTCTAALNQTTWWYGWADYVVPDVYTSVDEEISAVRSNVAMIDMSPLPKVEISGLDTIRFFDYLTVRRASNFQTGHAQYTCWCNEDGKLVSDGLAFRLQGDRILISADTSYEWLKQSAKGFDVSISDTTDDYGILSLQGPNARAVLSDATGENWNDFRFSRLRNTKAGGADIFIARQGFTGELGYEIWVKRQDGPAVWDAFWASGEKYGINAVGEYAVDVARIEAGLILSSAEYTKVGPDARCAHVEVDPDEVSSPYEVGLGYLVHLDKGDFIGRDALAQELEGGIKRKLVGLELQWRDIIEHYSKANQPPEIAPRVRWDAMPVLAGGERVGRASSVTWSPTLNALVSFGIVKTEFAQPGTELTVDWSDQWLRPIGQVKARVVDLPFVKIKREAA